MSSPSEHWERIDAILDRLFELEGDARELELIALTPDDEGLRREIRALLAADARPSADFDRFLEDGAAPLAEGVLGEVQDPVDLPLPSRSRIGPYEIERVLGSGGMSIVYLGRRRDGEFRQDVAIKALRHPGRHPDLVRRFRIERQILAHLRHPNIARILDGGVADGGWPYLVMEYVEGVPLNEHCALTGATLARRLQLFDEVCSAVHHAHQRLVVHRDLKPSNILVTAEGRVKLLDFGIAKLLDAGDSGYDQTVPMTETGLRLFTPDYAAPEQVRGEPITTATDVYALGILLYELLAGERPYRLQGRRAADVERIVCEQDPAPPSTMAVRTGAHEDGTPTHFDAGAKRWRALLRGDLDTICLKALRKEPEHRYASAQEMAADLQRYREGLPVSARPATAGYRLVKFVRRNRLAVAALTTITLVSLAFAIVATVQKQETRQARDRAEQQARTATELTGFLLGLFESTDPREARGDSITALDLLDRGVTRAARMRGQPRVQAGFLAVMGNAYRQLGQLDRAAELLRESLAVLEREQAQGQSDWFEARSSLAGVLGDLGRLEEAREIQEQVLDHQRRTLGGEAHGTAAASFALAQTLRELGQLDRADSLMTAALAVFRARDDSSPKEILNVLGDLATLEADRGDFERATVLSESVLVRRQALLGPDHLDVALTLHNLAAYARRLGDAEKAERLYRESIAIKRAQLPDPHPDLARSIDNLAIAVGVQGRYDEAEELFLEALRMRRALFGDDHPRVAPSLSNLSTLMQRKGDPRRALEYSGRAVAVYRNAYDTPNGPFAAALRTHAVALAAMGRLEEARSVSEESLRQLEELYGEDSLQAATSRGNLAAVVLDQGDVVQAEALRRQTLVVQVSGLGEVHPDVATTWSGLADALDAQGRTVEADSAYTRALEIRTQVFGPGHPLTVEVEGALRSLRER